MAAMLWAQRGGMTAWFKLHKLSAKGQILRLINDCYIETKIAVNQSKSDYYPVYEGIHVRDVLFCYCI